MFVYISAAHCVHDDDGRLSNQTNFVVFLGLHRRSRKGEAEVQHRNVTSIVPHPDYDHKWLYNDLALLKLGRKVEVTKFVLPICLPKSQRFVLKSEHSNYYIFLVPGVFSSPPALHCSILTQFPSFVT